LPEPISVSFTYSRAEYIRAMRRHYRTILHVRLDVAIAIVMIALGCYMTYSRLSAMVSLFGIVAGAVLLVIVSYAWFMLPRQIYASQSKLMQQYDLVFSDAEISFRTAGIDSRLDWSIYQKWLADDEFYILYYGKRSLTIIPRRVFSDDSADQVFHELLVRKIGNSMLVSSRRHSPSTSTS
jgi:hypothetical protein